jgi:hypothetical protein
MNNAQWFSAVTALRPRNRRVPRGLVFTALTSALLAAYTLGWLMHW